MSVIRPISLLLVLLDLLLTFSKKMAFTLGLQNHEHLWNVDTKDHENG